MKLVLTLVILSLCAAWVVSYGPETELETKSDISALVREEREALAGKRKKKNNNNKIEKKIKTDRTKKANKDKKNKEKKRNTKSGDKKGNKKKRQNKKKVTKFRKQKNRNKNKKKNEKKKKRKTVKSRTTKRKQKEKNKKKKSSGKKTRKNSINKEKIIKQISEAIKKEGKNTKSKENQAQRQDASCTNTDDVTDECLENAQKVLLFEGYYRTNFRNQYLRFKSQNKTRGNKIDKKIAFNEPAQHLADAVGGNLTRMNTNMSCVYGGDNKTHYENEFKATYQTLVNCSNFIGEYCHKLDTDNVTWNAMEQCYEEMDSTKTKTEKCRNIGTSGADQCECWSDLKTNHVDVVKAIRPKCSGMQKIAKEMRIHKDTCVEKFKECKKAQDYSILLIYHCMHFDVGETWNPVTNETKVVSDSKDLAAKAVVEGASRNFHQFISV